jgi:hypothetical protein
MKAGRLIHRRLTVAYRWLVLVSSMGCGITSFAVTPTLDVAFSCSVVNPNVQTDQPDDQERVLYADVGKINVQGDRIQEFRWESSLFRSTHGFDCSIDDGDGLSVELSQSAAGAQQWRVQLQDARAARTARGYDANHGFDCAIDLSVIDSSGGKDSRLLITPNCPALCGSRENFSTLSVDLKTGHCDYEH